MILYDEYDFENLVKVDDNTAAMVSRQLGTYGLGTNVSRSLMVNQTVRKNDVRKNRWKSSKLYILIQPFYT